MIKNLKKIMKRTGNTFRIASGAWHASSRTKATVRYLLSLPGDADENNKYELPDLRYKTGELIRNYPIATAIINRKRNTIVGSGIRIRPDIDYKTLGISKDVADEINNKLLSAFRLWANPIGTCDIENQVNFSQYQRLLLDSRLERGDVFTIFTHKKRRGCPFNLRLQMIEADQVSNPNFRADTPTLRDGIERTLDGEVVAIHYQYSHPGNTSNADKMKWQRVPIFSADGKRRVLHYLDKRRRGQSRGVPDLTPVIEPLAQLTKFSEAYLHKALVNAFFTFAYKGDDLTSPLDGLGEEASSSTDNRDPLRKLGIGTALELSADETVEAIESKTPNSEYTPYRDAIIHEVGMAINVPPEILMTLFSTSYTAAQAAFMEYWRYVETERDMLYCQLKEIYNVLFDDILMSGLVHINDYNPDDLIGSAAYKNCMMVAPPKGHLRPEALNKADMIAEDRGWKTPEQNAQERGNDYVEPKNQQSD